MSGRRARSSEVLIVGAGPTGMVLALLLHRYGVSVRLIDKSPARRPGSKALTLNTVSQRTMDHLGLAEALRARSFLMDRATILHGGKRLCALDFARMGAPREQLWMIPQWETEQVLESALQDAEIPIERATELVELDTRAHHSRATTRAQEARREGSEHRYVIGCDGARSRVRAAMNLPFAGRDYAMHMLLADARVEWSGRRDQGFYFVEDHGFLILLPLPNGYHRIVVKRDGPLDDSEQLDLATVRRAVHSAVGARVQVSDPIWLSRAPFYNRIAPSFATGNTILAGDAAHLFSPLGGFGMNTGIADAYNLAWRLAYAVGRRTPASVVDGYDAERRPLAQRLVATNEHFTALAARLPERPPADDVWLPRMRNRQHLRRLPYATGLAHSYVADPGGQAGSVASAGALALRAGLGPCDRHRLIYLPRRGEELAWTRAASAIAREWSAILQLHSLDSNPLDERAKRFWSPADPAPERIGFAALLRPDAYLESLHRGPSALRELARTLRSHYGAQHRGEELHD